MVAAACADLGAAVAPNIGTPAGWTREIVRSSANTFFEQSVFWKIASGSEGATVNFTITSMNNIDCGARYWKFTGYNTSNPIDATDIAWATTLTPNPPSQTVTGGPLDVYIIAFASDRGDNTYSAGSDLTTNAHQDAAGISSGRSTAVSYGAYTAISSKDPGTFTFTAVARDTSAVTAVIYPAATTPTFTSAPTYAKVDNNTIRATFTCNGSTATARGGLYVLGASTPTAAQVAAGTNAHGTLSAMCTGSSQTLDIDATDNPVFPGYDPYVILDLSGVYSTVPTTTSTCVDPPASKQFINCATGLTAVNSAGSVPAAFNAATFVSIAYGSQSANFTVGAIVVGGTSGAYGFIQSDADGGATGVLYVDVRSGTLQNGEALTDNYGGAATATGVPATLPAMATGDILVEPTTVSPGGGALAVTTDGQFSYSGTGRQSALNALIYDKSAGNYMVMDADFWDHNAAPGCTGAVEQYVFKTGVAITPVDLNSWCSDPDLIAMQFAKLTTTALPTGLTLDKLTGIISGTPTVENEAGVTFTFAAADDAQDYATKQILIYPITSWTVTPNCAAAPTTAASCTGSIDSLTHSSVTVTTVSAHSATVAAGNVISMSPAAGAELAPGGTETLTISSGTGGGRSRLRLRLGVGL